ncbi:MAG: ArsR family transcriptional regulator [Deltaproteobacteria bacterium]|nr:ArsR family transcriptional regulator [Deltaproteobacteria bacterium]
MRSHSLTTSAVRLFRKIIYQHYKKHGRDLPWRKTTNPYHILVSEVMLQQTQVERVLQKYSEFIAVFPDFQSLSKAPLRKALRVWQGMGYNRRAIALKEIAKIVVNDFKGVLPDSVNTLITFPGIGRATASAICAFAYNQPTVFIETNIRRVFIHCFFHDRDNIRDADILPLIEKKLDKRNPREWYYVLMDYGVMLKKQFPKQNQRSAHYQKQAPFQGSNRQMRGKILKALIDRPATSAKITSMLKCNPKQVRKVLAQLKKEGFIIKKGTMYSIGR